MLTTAVVGAGPAGLLFTLIGKILMGERWDVRLYDKRESYVRTHRLRMAKEPYLAIGEDLQDARFDALLAFLGEHHFTPEVNLLEAKLTELLADLGVQKQVREITDLASLGVETIVGADSVHSTVRDLVRGSVEPKTHTHERVARLRVTGSDLPERLSVIDQYRLSKVLGSVVDYRRNSNGFAEVDLFLSEKEHAAVAALGASPKDPVPINTAMLRRAQAPLMRAIVAQLEHGAERAIVLQSTFRLEHAVMPKVSFEAPQAHEGRVARVFLLGDAGVSLPFFRGMACLASCAHALAKAHATQTLDSYEPAVQSIVEREVKVVRARAQIIRGVRELVRVSSLLPFPIQSWWLSAGTDPEPDAIAPSTYFNLLVATSSVLAAALGFVSPWLAVISLPLQVGGGVAYRWTLSLEPGPHRYLRRVWEIQIALAGIAGIAGVYLGRLPWVAAGWWWILGVAFVLGIYVFERLVARRLKHADLGGDEAT